MIRVTHVTIHLGLAPLEDDTWTAEPVLPRGTPLQHLGNGGHVFRYDADSFREWGEPPTFGDPHHVTTNVQVPADWAGEVALDREGLTELARAALGDLRRILGRSTRWANWRALDYVVVTSAEEWSRGARTVGEWGA